MVVPKLNRNWFRMLLTWSGYGTEFRTLVALGALFGFKPVGDRNFQDKLSF